MKRSRKLCELKVGVFFNLIISIQDHIWEPSAGFVLPVRYSCTRDDTAKLLEGSSARGLDHFDRSFEAVRFGAL